jgi:ABC-type transporter Mla subunit MlaD
MGLADKLSALTRKAQDAAVEHRDQVEQAVENAATLADQQTGGRYHNKIAKAKGKADEYLDQQARRQAPPATDRPVPEGEPEPTHPPADIP